MTPVTDATDVPVRKSIIVNASVEHAFKVFTEGFDSWWPRSHHIGKGTLQKAVIETRLGGRCYGREADGTECPWGTVLIWEPPHRFVIAWQITHEWGYESDLKKSSEVEVQFTTQAGGTRVDLEHRDFNRMGPGGATMRIGVDAPGGWGTLLDSFKQAAEKPEERRS
jgi:uncharacterized protein YndB with AHSA1/START domain